MRAASVALFYMFLLRRPCAKTGVVVPWLYLYAISGKMFGAVSWFHSMLYDV